MTGGANPQGSVWRRWDPHVHLPGTLLSDHYGSTTVGEALDILANCAPGIEVVGVTDYATTRSFRQAQAAHAAGHGTSIKLLFPNVELRFTIPTSRGPGINIHLLCAPEDVDELDRFLRLLEFTWHERTYNASPTSLMELGRAFENNSTLEEEAALTSGANQFKVSLDNLRSRFRSDQWARDRLLLAVSGGTGDGTSGLAKDTSFAAQRQELDRLCPIILTATPSQHTYWSGVGADSLDELARKYGGPKLCLHGSDAHTIERLGVPVDDRRMWLKGDATFETLRQTCIEPIARSAIGPEAPSRTAFSSRIVALQVETTGGWFVQEPVPINPGLVAIIRSVA